LLRSLPPIEFTVARDIALVADHHGCLTDVVEIRDWAADRGLHFTRSSTFGSKGRLLFNVVRIMRCERCLELGTAYGMSALFILAALKKYAPSGSLATLELSKEIASITSPILKQHYGDMVSCHVGDTRTGLCKLAQSLGKIDFLFHDSGHSRDDYVNDFNNVVDHLAPGAVVLFDDINWADTRLCGGDTDTYGGWTAVASHPRVRQAVEVDDSLGLLLLA
jgi:predicted O-methyltransferase YrrM